MLLGETSVKENETSEAIILFRSGRRANISSFVSQGPKVGFFIARGLGPKTVLFKNTHKVVRGQLRVGVFEGGLY